MLNIINLLFDVINFFYSVPVAFPLEKSCDNAFNGDFVIAFPKTQSATCLLTDAPSKVDDAQLEELKIISTHKEE